MASPQIEHGYTRIANELLEALANTPLNGTQWRILAVVFRYTYGFNRKMAELSENYIAKATGIHRKQINREINALISYGLLIVKRQASFSSPRVISFNKNYEVWNVSTKTLTGNKIDTPDGKAATTVNGLVDTTVNGLVDQEINNIKKDINIEHADEFFEKIWILYPKKRGKGQVTKRQKEKLYKIGYDEMSRTIERYRQEIQGKDLQFVMYGSTFFNSGYVDYLDKNYQDANKLDESSQYRDLTNYFPGGES